MDMLYLIARKSDVCMDSLCAPPSFFAALGVDDARGVPFSPPPSSTAAPLSLSFSFASNLPIAMTSVVTTFVFAPTLPSSNRALKLPIRCPFQLVSRCCFFNLSARLENLCGFIRFLACAPFGPLLFAVSPLPVASITLFGFSGGATLLASDFRSSCAMSAWLRAIFRFRSSSYSVKFASFSSMLIYYIFCYALIDNAQRRTTFEFFQIYAPRLRRANTSACLFEFESSNVLGVSQNGISLCAILSRSLSNAT